LDADQVNSVLVTPGAQHLDAAMRVDANDDVAQHEYSGAPFMLDIVQDRPKGRGIAVNIRQKGTSGRISCLNFAH
jgi:hypothetical protein